MRNKGAEICWKAGQVGPVQVNQLQVTRPSQVRKLVGQPRAGQNPAMCTRGVNVHMFLQVAKRAT